MGPHASDRPVSACDHSPGPWRGDRTDGSIKYRILAADGHTVLLIDEKNGTHGFLCDPDVACPLPWGRHDADKLLVLAAPNLLLTLKRAVELLDCWNTRAVTRDFGCNEGHRCPACLVAEGAERVFAQVEGRAPSVERATSEDK